MEYRLASDADIPAMARIRAATRGTEAYWSARIAGYLAGTVNPQKSLPLRAAFVALDDTKLIGFVAGHLTRRLGCAGELQWIDVAKDERGTGMGRSLLRIMAEWF